MNTRGGDAMTDIGRPHTLASAGEGSARSNATGYMVRCLGVVNWLLLKGGVLESVSSRRAAQD